ncbi:MAG: hypothetical protein MJE68_04860, partial [Proteobacteria bacterium]|nr:hypothetical protein [Pseudomonadota bacterium]
LDPVEEDVVMIVHQDLTDEDAVRVTLNDLSGDGLFEAVSDQMEAPTHSGVVSFDNNNYKIADTVIVTLEDQDLNTDVETIDVFTVVSVGTDVAADQVGVPFFGVNSEGDNFGRLLDITFDDQLWLNSQFTGSGVATCGAGNLATPDDGLGSTGFTLVETEAASGKFMGDFQIPITVCQREGTTSAALTSVTGLDMEVNYVDYRDASGEIIEVGDSAGIRANTGSISLDRTVYPVPWGQAIDFGNPTTTDSGGFAVFPIHASGVNTGESISDASTTTAGLQSGNLLSGGDLTIHVRVNDPDFDESASGEDDIDQLSDTDSDGSVADERAGPVRITISRGGEEVTLATAGGPTALNGTITVVNSTQTTKILQAASGNPTRELGPINEIAPDAGIFELDMVIRYTDGPSSTQCPTTTSFHSLSGAGSTSNHRFSGASTVTNYCILQGDILTVEYRDPTDASGDPNTV